MTPIHPKFPHTLFSSQTRCEEFEHFPSLLASVWPLQKNHRKSLASDIRELSTLLTQERFFLAHPYWKYPAAISSYLYYFLPWNLVRLISLLQGEIRDILSLPKNALLLDLGSGPLTVPLALWYASPHLRDLPLTIVVQDRSLQPLEIGEKLLSTLNPPWTIVRTKTPIPQLPRFFHQKKLPKPFLITAANMLNEILVQKRYFREEESEESAFEELDPFLDALFSLSDAEGFFLGIEPGTRLGGKIIMRLREEARRRNFFAHLPCPHQGICPLLQGKGRKTWCHFTFPCHDIPTWLQELSAEAGLEKRILSLSPLLLSQKHPLQQKNARILSNPISLPKHGLKARYACSKDGLLLIEDDHMHQGFSLPYALPPHAMRDEKSSALIVRKNEESPKKTKRS